MGFIAESILLAHMEPAPKEYESINVIAENKPKGEYEDMGLMQISKSTVVGWYVKHRGTWRLASGYYVVSKERIIHQRGARYTKEKEAFVKKYYTELFDYIISKQISWRHILWVEMINRARTEVGYSPCTAQYDVYHGISKEFMKQYKGVKNIK